MVTIQCPTQKQTAKRVRQAVQVLVTEKNKLFDKLSKNLEKLIVITLRKF